MESRKLRRGLLPILIIAALLAGCATDNKSYPKLEGKIAMVDEYGDLVPSFSVAEVLEAGYEYGDVLSVKIGSLPEMNMPFVTAYTDVGTMGICFCDYNKRGNAITIAITNADFQSWIGGAEGDDLTVSMAKKRGFLKEYNAVQVTMTSNREDYASDEIFANFREIRTTGIGPNKLYRSSNPFNPAKNKVRYSYASALAGKSGINTIINLADTDAKILASFSAEGYNAPYARNVYNRGNVIALGMAADFFKQDSLRKLADGFRFMISHRAPYLFHCNEGKDRAGGFAAILEALAGASLDEIRDDYMTTYVNYYHLDKGDEKYKELQKITIDHLMYLICNPDMVSKLNTIDWSRTDVENLNVNEGVRNYLINCVGLSAAECDQLKRILSGN